MPTGAAPTRGDQTDEPWPPDAWMRTDDDGRVVLVGGWSPTSGQAHFPPGPLCPYSGADDVEARDLPRTGTLFAWTAVTAAPPGYDGPVPYGFGIVALAGPEIDGTELRVIGRLTEADPAALSFGQAMEVVAEELPGGRRLWAFAPATTSP